MNISVRMALGESETVQMEMNQGFKYSRIQGSKAEAETEREADTETSREEST